MGTYYMRGTSAPNRHCAAIDSLLPPGNIVSYMERLPTTTARSHPRSGDTSTDGMGAALVMGLIVGMLNHALELNESLRKPDSKTSISAPTAHEPAASTNPGVPLSQDPDNETSHSDGAADTVVEQIEKP